MLWTAVRAASGTVHAGCMCAISWDCKRRIRQSTQSPSEKTMRATGVSLESLVFCITSP